MESTTIVRLRRFECSGVKYKYQFLSDKKHGLNCCKRLLVLFLDEDKPMYWCVRVSALLRSSNHIPSVLDAYKESEVPISFHRLTCPIVTDGYLYLIGGLDTNRALSSNVTRVKLDSHKLIVDSTSGRSSTHSANRRFFAVEHRGIIYVLGSVSRSFEAYYPTDDKWIVLESFPSCVGDNYEFSYFVKANKICVSYVKGAFEYDIDERKWKPCFLFGEGKVAFATLFFQQPRISKGGTPFPYFGQGIYHEGWLIAIVPEERTLVGYEIDSNSERVVSQQILYELLDVDDPDISVLSQSLVALGDGYFCATYITSVDIIYNAKLVMVTLEVSKLKRGNGFHLSSVVCSRHETDANYCFPGGCSAFSFAF